MILKQFYNFVKNKYWWLKPVEKPFYELAIHKNKNSNLLWQIPPVIQIFSKRKLYVRSEITF